MLTIRSWIPCALLFFISLQSVVAAPQYRHDLRHRRACGSHLSAERREASERRFASHRIPAANPNGTATLDIYIHVVYANETTEGGYLSDDQISRQMEVLNEDYTSIGISFNLINVTRIENEDWFLNLAPDTDEEFEMKTTYRYGNASTLNVWTVGFKSDEGKGLLGYATFPADYESAPDADGVVLLYKTFPGGDTEPYNKGRTMTHEVGHWKGLYHTFEGGCAGKGDYVADTPAVREANYGCPVPKPSCPGQKAAAVRNFMDYTDDSCMTSFTSGQRERIRSNLRSFRGIDTL